MALELLDHCTFTGPALPEPFVRFDLEAALLAADLLPKPKDLADVWDFLRRKLRDLGERGGNIRVLNHVVEPLLQPLGYARIEAATEVSTREGPEPGGYLMAPASRLEGAGPSAPSSTPPHLRVWTYAFDEDLDAPPNRAAYRFSPARVAQRVLLAAGERLGLITNGAELRVLISDPARPDSEISIGLASDWRRAREVPDSFRLLVALASPKGVAAIPDLVEKARLHQVRVTRDLRTQAREAIEGFVQEILDHPENRAILATHTDPEALAREFWREGLIVVYRLLFILKLESTDDPARAFHFASSGIWRRSFSPTLRLAEWARASIERNEDTGALIEHGLRTLFRMFARGLETPELHVAPLGGTLFGEAATPLIAKLHWGERASARLLYRLLWVKRRPTEPPQRVHYGPLDVEDLGRVYEALLELEPGIATEPMCRLRRQKLEVVVPLAQGERYRTTANIQDGGRRSVGAAVSDDTETDSFAEDAADNEAEDTEDSTEPKRGKKTKVEWIEEIHPGRFYLRVGLGRKSSGSYYTPHSFVRFLVQETLGPQVAERSPTTDPNPAAILALKVLDPAMGSGHFLVEACRFLGEKLYEACRLCDEKARAAEEVVARGLVPREANDALAAATQWRTRLLDLPDPNDELAYLPTHAPEDTAPGLSEQKALALCRRLVAVHCLYGVDKNPLAVELAKLSLWLESHAEGLPLTFLDHRLVLGDSLTGPFFEHLLTFPGTQQPLDDLFTKGLREQLTKVLAAALVHVRELEATVGVTLADLLAKQAAMAKLNAALAPFHTLAAVWAGGVMLGGRACDDVGYGDLARSIADRGVADPTTLSRPTVGRMLATGHGATGGAEAGSNPARALPYDLTFPEVFFPTGAAVARHGFDVVLGNPPWDAIQFKSKEFFAAFDFEILNAPTKRERERMEVEALRSPVARALFEHYKEDFEQQKRANDVLFRYQKVQIEGDLAGRQLDAFRVFMERNAQILAPTGLTGVVVPSAFHANEGATGIRQLYLEVMGLRCCYSFENRRKLFEIDSRFKFAVVVVSRKGPTLRFPCAFYLHDDKWLFGSRNDSTVITLDLLRRATGAYLNFPEFKAAKDVEVFQRVVENATPLGNFCEEHHIVMRSTPEALHMTHDADRFVSSDGVLQRQDLRDPRIAADALRQHQALPLHEGKTFHQYTDAWGDPPRFAVRIHRLTDKPASWKQALRYFRLAIRMIASATNERTAIAALLPPAVVVGHSVAIDQTPMAHPFRNALTALAIANSFVFDWHLRQVVGANVTLFLIRQAPWPVAEALNCGFLEHCALRLSASHGGYAPLWDNQLGDAWREPNPPFTWPVLASNDDRWEVRTAIDAVVANAYGLSGDQYAHILSTFNHKSYPKAPALCLARFDELKAAGLEAFTRKYDPYWDIPLNENLPQPVIDLPVPADADASSPAATHPTLDLVGGSSSPRRKQRRDAAAGEGGSAAPRQPAGQDAHGEVSGSTNGALPLAAETTPHSAERLSTPDLWNSPSAGDISRHSSAENTGGGRAPALRQRTRRMNAANGVDPEAFDRVKALLAERQVITSADVQYLLATNASGARPYLHALITQGLAVTEGQRRGLRYRATGVAS